jgi:hypothetical protein
MRRSAALLGVLAAAWRATGCPISGSSSETGEAAGPLATRVCS